MQNILIVTNNYSSFTKDQIELVAAHFNKVTVLARHNPIADFSNYIPINRMLPFRKKAKIDRSDKPDNVDLIVTPLYYLPTDRGYKKLGIKHYKKVVSIIRKYNIKFDLVHSHFLWSSGYVGSRLREEFDKPFIVTAHGYDVYDLPFRDSQWRASIQSVLKSADFIITVSRKNKSILQRLSPSLPVSVIPNGYKSDLFGLRDTQKCRERLQLPLDKKIVLTVGNLVKIKGHEYLIKSIKEVLNKHYNTLCIIVGSGEQKRNLLKLIKEQGLENHIMLTGRRVHSEIPMWINACDVFVLPSLSEGNPTVMFECLACGKPFIGTDVGGIPEIIINDNYGYIVGPADKGKLSNAIVTSLNREWDRELIHDYSKYFSWENLTIEIIDVYNKAGNK